MKEFFSFSSLVNIGIHLGCSYSNFKLLSGWLVLKFRGDLCIVNLYKTIYIIKLSLFSVDYTVRTCKPI